MIKVITDKTGRQFLHSTIVIEKIKSNEVGFNATNKDDLKMDIPVKIRASHIVAWYKHEFKATGKFDRTMVELSHGGSLSIKCTVRQFEKVFLNL